MKRLRFAQAISLSGDLAASAEPVTSREDGALGLTFSRRRRDGLHDFLAFSLVPGDAVPLLQDRPRSTDPVWHLDSLLVDQFQCLHSNPGTIQTLDVASMLTSEAFKKFCTSHLLSVWWAESHGQINKDPAQIVERTALLFRDLTLWGEVAPAPVLAEWFDAPVGTIHNRLRLARERGLLAEAPGRGRRRRGVGA